MSPVKRFTASRLKSPLASLAAAALAVSLIGPLLTAHRAVAADLDYVPSDMPAAAPQQLVTFGSGWYVRGDIAAVDSAYDVDIARASKSVVGFDLRRSQDASYDLSLGGGYSFTNSFRADIVVDFHQPTQAKLGNEPCITTTASTCNIVGQFNHYDALINAYYDFGTWSIVTPYVGVGAGVGFGNVKTTLFGDTTVYSGSYGYHSFAWALMAGIALDVYSHVKLDIGYRYLNNGTIYNTKVYDNEIRAGLRYMIDN